MVSRSPFVVDVCRKLDKCVTGQQKISDKSRTTRSFANHWEEAPDLKIKIFSLGEIARYQ